MKKVEEIEEKGLFFKQNDSRQPKKELISNAVGFRGEWQLDTFSSFFFFMLTSIRTTSEADKN